MNCNLRIFGRGSAYPRQNCKFGNISTHWILARGNALTGKQKDQDAFQCWQNKRNAELHKLVMQEKEHGKSRGPKLWPASFHILSMSILYGPHRETLSEPRFNFHTLASCKTIGLSGTRTRPHDEYESCNGIQKKKANRGHSLALAVSYSLC